MKTDRTYATISSAGNLSQSSSASNSYLRPVPPIPSTTSSYLEPTPSTSDQSANASAIDPSRGSLTSNGTDRPDSGPSFGTYRQAYDHFKTMTRPTTRPKPALRPQHPPLTYPKPPDLSARSDSLSSDMTLTSLSSTTSSLDSNRHNSGENPDTDTDTLTTDTTFPSIGSARSMNNTDPST